MRKELPPIRERPEDYDAIEAAIDELFRKHLYGPLLKDMLPSMKAEMLKNAKDVDALAAAIKAGKVFFYRGEFKGKFTAPVSKELRALGAVWDKGTSSFKLPKSKIPREAARAIEASEARFDQVAKGIDSKLAKMMPEEIADALKVEGLFDKTLWRVNRELEENVKGITVVPEMTVHEREQVARDYTKNMKLYIQEWTEKEIVKLRGEVKESVLSGSRYEGLVKTIQKSYGVSQSKAKFLARQETNLMLTKFKHARYVEAGCDEYIWKTVVGSKNHPVRPMHKQLDGKTFKWSNPPITDKEGNRNNPGEDFNCRCYARPIVKF